MSLSIPALAEMPLSNLQTTKQGEQIYRAAIDPLAGRLWKAALGRVSTSPNEDGDSASLASDMPALPLLSESLVTAALNRAELARVTAQAEQTSPKETAPALTIKSRSYPVDMQQALNKAAQRVGVSADLLGSIITAEVGSNWRATAKNPNSSATGLGQFIASTWIGEAKRSGTYLNQLAQDRGLITAKGQVLDRQALLDLRNDAKTSIEALADFTKSNLNALSKEHSITKRSAYLAHHLGMGDAQTYLRNGKLGEDRARLVLDAQIGKQAASKAILRHGSAAVAHSQWLESYVARKMA